jgi:hypothetical protein
MGLIAADQAAVVMTPGGSVKATSAPSDVKALFPRVHPGQQTLDGVP